jgi:hypothetical protein
MAALGAMTREEAVAVAREALMSARFENMMEDRLN